MRLRALIQGAAALTTMIACSSEPTALADRLVLELDVPQTAKAGDEVPLRLTITNVSSERVTATLSCGGFEFEVFDAGGSSVYRSRGEARFSCGFALDLAPRESTVLSRTWHGNTQSGEDAPSGTLRMIASLWPAPGDGPAAVSNTRSLVLGLH